MTVIVCVEFDDAEDKPLTVTARRAILRAVARIHHHAGAQGPNLWCYCWHHEGQHRRGDGPCTADDEYLPGPCPCRSFWPVPESYPLDR